MDKITDAKLKKYFSVTGKALKKVQIVKKGKVDFQKSAEDFLDMSGTPGIPEHAQGPPARKKGKHECMCGYCQAHVVLDMASRYYSDAQHFADKGDKVNAFAALNYAHGWLDAGARLGLFDVDGDNVLFTVDAKE
jgi:hypothetical protein|tara:strand:- start:442 stop:846 length:405 start_codon:yes stop_codon:yes gene_type:complete